MLRTRRDAVLQPGPKTRGAQGKRVGRQGQLHGKLPPLLDSSALIAAIVIEDQASIGGCQLLQTPVEALESVVIRVRRSSEGLRHQVGSQPIGAPQRFEKDELCDDVAVALGRAFEEIAPLPRAGARRDSARRLRDRQETASPCA